MSLWIEMAKHYPIQSWIKCNQIKLSNPESFSFLIGKLMENILKSKKGPY